MTTEQTPEIDPATGAPPPDLAALGKRFAEANAALKAAEAAAEETLAPLKAASEQAQRAMFEGLVNAGVDNIGVTLDDGAKRTIYLHTATFANVGVSMTSEDVAEYVGKLREQGYADAGALGATLLAIQPDERIGAIFARVLDDDWRRLCRPRVNATQLSAMIREANDEHPIPELLRPLVKVATKTEARIVKKGSK